MTSPSSRLMARFSSKRRRIPAPSKPWRCADATHRLRRSSAKAPRLRRKPSADPARAGSPRSALGAREPARFPRRLVARRRVLWENEAPPQGASMQGRLAQRERRSLTRTRSQVQILYRPPEFHAGHQAFQLDGLLRFGYPPLSGYRRYRVTDQNVYLDFNRKRYGMDLRVTGQTRARFPWAA